MLIADELDFYLIHYLSCHYNIMMKNVSAEKNLVEQITFFSVQNLTFTICAIFCKEVQCP